jgi:two-component system, sensor histidine kinase and response regulator
VLLHAQVLADGLAGSLTPEQEKHARSMRDTALLLQRYGEALRALGQAESGGLELACEAFDVWEAVHKVAATLRVQAEMKGLALELQLAEDLGYARGDAARFERVLHQLIDWCIGGSDAGRITVAASLPGAGRLQVVVSDSGATTAVEARAQVLDFFAQDPALPQPLGHAGALGLAVARRIAHAMGATLAAEGRPEAAIRFVLTLPSDTLGA